jgi:hypothetical protein
MPTLPELKAKAKEMGLKGYSKMKKAELEALIAENTGRAEEEVEGVVKTPTDILKELAKLLEGETMEDKASILGVLYYLNKKFGRSGIYKGDYGDFGDDKISNMMEGELPERRKIFNKVGNILRTIEVGDLEAKINGWRDYTLKYSGIAKSDGGDEWGKILKSFMKSTITELESRKEREEREKREYQEKEEREEREKREREMMGGEDIRRLESKNEARRKYDEFVVTTLKEEVETQRAMIKAELLEKILSPDILNQVADALVDVAGYEYEGIIDAPIRRDFNKAENILRRVLRDIHTGRGLIAPNKIAGYGNDEQKRLGFHPLSGR